MTGISILTGLMFGLVPAIRATGVDLAGAMKESSRSVTGGKTWLSKGLLVAQVAMSLVLLIGAGLFLRTLHNLRSVDVGFNAEQPVDVPDQSAGQSLRVRPHAAALHADARRAGGLPGVRSVAFTRTGAVVGRDEHDRHAHPGASREQNDIHVMSVSPEFFDDARDPGADRPRLHRA